ncbi:hypothetical protein WA158_004882 [Blastocystis sp. Blastoise]
MSTPEIPVNTPSKPIEEIKNPGVYSEMWNDVIKVLDTDDRDSGLFSVFSYPYKNFNFQFRSVHSNKTPVYSGSAVYDDPNLFAIFFASGSGLLKQKTIFKYNENFKFTFDWDYIKSKKHNMADMMMNYTASDFGLQFCFNTFSGIRGTYLQAINNNIHIGTELVWDCISNKNWFVSGAFKYTNPLYTYIIAATGGHNLFIHYLKNVTKNVKLAASLHVYPANTALHFNAMTTLAALFDFPRTGVKLNTSINGTGAISLSLLEPISPSTSLSLQSNFNPFLDLYSFCLGVRFGPKNEVHLNYTPITQISY